MATTEKNQVEYRETVAAKSSMTSTARSPDKLNRIFITAEPIEEEVVKAIEKGDVSPNDDFKHRARILAYEYGWDATDARKIWAFGLGPDSSANLLVDQTKAIKYLSEIQSDLIAAFQSVTKEGPVSGLPMRGVRFNIVDVVLVDDASGRGAGQLVETARRAICAAFLLASPTLLEPVYLATIQVPESASNTASNLVTKRDGNIFSEGKAGGDSSYTIGAYVPAMKSIGLEADLKAAIKGQVSVQLDHDHWKSLQGGSLDPESQAGSLAVELRQEKGLPAEIPSFETYHDKV
ncbi:Elongation factor 2 [Arthrobotrys conoides]|uniref:Elongation factor 2 n=1 Tax=Arthrobotrys conoides TaxID=74498 RepID=A0AAN8NUT2_9PEZI